MTFKTIIAALCVAQAATAELADGLYAEFATSMGSFTCQLDHAEAPLTVANFVGLVEGSQPWLTPAGAVKNGDYYDGLIFHRVMDGFMIQGGDPLGTGTGGPGYAFPDQISTNILHSSAGTLSMANSGPNSNGSQFFITLAATSWLDGQHAVFGGVVDGMNVVSNIGVVATDSGSRPLTNVVMNTVRILRVGAEAAAYDPTAEPLPEVSALPVTLGDDVSVATSNQCEQFIFSSTNLTDWAPAAENYTPTAAADLVAEIPTNSHCGFYRGARVFYPQANTIFSDLEGKKVFFQQDANEFEFSPVAGGLGACDIAGTPDALTFWAEWSSEPYVARIIFQPESFNAFQFVWSRSGDCEGYQYTGSGWSYIGIWTFGERDVIPEG